jgi:uncharacterized protein (DUF885 family)
MVKQIAESYIKRLVNRQHELIKKYDSNMTKKTFLQRIFKSSSNTFKSSEELKEYSEELLTKIEKEIFKYIPKPSFYVKPKLEFHSDSNRFLGEASYGNLQKGGAPIFFINLSNWNDIYKSHLVPILLHEALPGHCFSYEYKFQTDKDKSQPIWSKPIYFNEIDESISLIAESLLEENNLYKSKEEQVCQSYSRLEFLLWRVIRCVIDVNMHIYGHSKDQLLKYMKQYLLWSSDILEKELYRYSDFPGQACGYFLGYIQLMDCYQDSKSNFKNKYSFYQCILENQSFNMETILKNCLEK